MSRLHTNGALRRSAVVAVAAAALLAVTTACSSSSGGGGSSAGPAANTGASGASGDLGTITVSPVVPNSDLFIAVEAAEQLGTWKGTGLTVKVVPSTQATVGQIMASGQADIGLTAGPGGLAAIARGLKATVVGSCYSPWGQLFIVRKNWPGDTVEALKGANFGSVGAGSAGDFSVDALAKAMHWSSGDYKKTSLGSVQALTAGLKSGAIDAFAWSSQTAYTLVEQGVAKVVGDAADYVSPTVFDSFSVMDSVIKNRPEAVKAFFEGYYKTVQRIIADPQIAIDVMVKDWNVSEYAAKKAAEIDLPKLSTDGKISDEELAGLAEDAKEQTGVTVDNPAEHYTYWKDIG